MSGWKLGKESNSRLHMTELDNRIEPTTKVGSGWKNKLCPREGGGEK